MKNLNQITVKTVEELDNQIQELKKSVMKPKVLTINLVDTNGDFSLVSNILSEIRKNKIKLHVTATGNISGAGIILLAAGTRGKRDCTFGSTLSFDNHKSDQKTQKLISVLETVYRIDRNKLLSALNSDGVLNTEQTNVLKLCDRITYGGRRVSNPLIPKKVKVKPSKQTQKLKKLKKEVNKA